MSSEAPTIVSVIILDKNGGRVACKYFSERFATNSSQTVYEKNLSIKAAKQVRLRAQFAQVSIYPEDLVGRAARRGHSLTE